MRLYRVHVGWPADNDVIRVLATDPTDAIARVARRGIQQILRVEPIGGGAVTLLWRAWVTPGGFYDWNDEYGECPEPYDMIVHGTSYDEARRRACRTAWVFDGPDTDVFMGDLLGPLITIGDMERTNQHGKQ